MASIVHHDPVGSTEKPTAGGPPTGAARAIALDVPLGDARLRALELLGDRWSLWILLAVHETSGARFTDLAREPGLSRRVLAERLRELVEFQLLATEQYSARPPRNRYVLTDRGRRVRGLALAAVHVAAGGRLEEPSSAPAGSRAPAADISSGAAQPPAVVGDGTAADEIEAGSTADQGHPADRLLAGDPQAARRILEESVAPLVRYDDQYRTSLVETLSTWLACDASVSVAAAQLYAHRHTIRYRLDRIRELTGLDPSATEDRERLALGLRALRLAGDDL